ncbi:hypothetical protein [Mycolicibacterium sp. 050158]|uniref:hypothetical protein n=1 Tax=Mycolicibacterium sp. 050158 TaxID=3090602 RepID=UPI00299F3F30|nr:hypothetical protein [Mycolicibacterium sp. 050158]MDX1891897.1 hypothetical protein [Mycolicibacterium sp. 050158]
MTSSDGATSYLTGPLHPDTDQQNGARVTVPFIRRLQARVLASRYDEQLERGVPVAAGSPLAAHRARLLSRRERQDMAASVTLLLSDAGRLPHVRGTASRMPIRIDAVEESADVVRDVLARLLGPLPVRARGMARLRLLLGDGRGPLYRSGSFAAAMRGVLAAM